MAARPSAPLYLTPATRVECYALYSDRTADRTRIMRVDEFTVRCQTRADLQRIRDAAEDELINWHAEETNPGSQYAELAYELAGGR